MWIPRAWSSCSSDSKLVLLLRLELLDKPAKSKAAGKAFNCVADDPSPVDTRPRVDRVLLKLCLGEDNALERMDTQEDPEKPRLDRPHTSCGGSTQILGHDSLWNLVSISGTTRASALASYLWLKPPSLAKGNEGEECDGGCDCPTTLRPFESLDSDV